MSTYQGCCGVPLAAAFLPQSTHSVPSTQPGLRCHPVYIATTATAGGGAI